MPCKARLSPSGQAVRCIVATARLRARVLEGSPSGSRPFHVKRGAKALQLQVASLGLSTAGFFNR